MEDNGNILAELRRELLEMRELLELKTRPALTEAEAEKYTGIGRQTLRKAAKAGALAVAHPSGKKPFYLRDELDAWIKASSRRESVRSTASLYAYSGGTLPKR